MRSCQARTVSTEPSPLPVVVTTSVGAAMRCTSSRTSTVGTICRNPSRVEGAVRPIICAHHSSWSGVIRLPMRPPFVARTQARTPSRAICARQPGVTAAMSRREAGAPSTASRSISAGNRAATASAIVPPILPPTRCTFATPSAPISAATSSTSAPKRQAWSAGIAGLAP
jgi:hypothetical protein